MGEEVRDLRRAHVFGVPQAMEPNEPFDPIAIRSFCSQAVMLQAQDITRLIEQLFRLAPRNRWR